MDPFLSIVLNWVRVGFGVEHICLVVTERSSQTQRRELMLTVLLGNSITDRFQREYSLCTNAIILLVLTRFISS